MSIMISQLFGMQETVLCMLLQAQVFKQWFASLDNIHMLKL